MQDKPTLVTGLWDIGRSGLTESFARSFDHYLESFRKLLAVDCNMIIYGDMKLAEFVYEHRKHENTLFITRGLDWFKRDPMFTHIQNIRKKESWLNITGEGGWLKNSTQACLEFYNPIVMSKIHLLHDAMIMDKFGSSHLFWIDAGLANTVNMGYFTHDKVLDKVTKYMEDVLFISFPYDATSDIHGFDYEKLKEYTWNETKHVVRGGFFGGRATHITWLMEVYDNLLNDTLSKGLMGTEETIFTILSERYPKKITRHSIESNGFLNTFFEGLKNDTLKVVKSDKTTIYVLAFNYPDQFNEWLHSAYEYDSEAMDICRKVLINNSTKEETFERYDNLCEEYGFEQIKFPEKNIGICRAREYVANHFDKSDSEYMIFFEDDMLFSDTGSALSHSSGEVSTGFGQDVNNLIPKAIKIMKKEGLDYLKLSFKEFFGDNTQQWGWPNLPEHAKKELYPNTPLSSDRDSFPPTEYSHSGIHEGLYYLIGKPHYCNWPILFNREGNRKVFLETTWPYPFEQTWMSYVLQEMHKGNIKAGVLLLNPIFHHRFEFAHYSKEERKEN